MNKRLYTIILFLIGSSVIGIIAMQSYYLNRQFQSKSEELEISAKRALANLDEHLRSLLNNRADLDTDNISEIDLYYESQDSTIEFIFESATRLRNVDGSLHEVDEEILQKRLLQFQDYIKLLDSTTEKDQKVEENFIVLYGQKNIILDSEGDWKTIVRNFAVDSLMSHYLKEEGYTDQYQFAIYDDSEGVWEHLNSEIDTATFKHNSFSRQILNDDNIAYLLFDQSKNHVLNQLAVSIILSGLLALLILGSLVFMLKIILKQKQVSEIKNDFINNMTHELKTPLATIAFATANIENPAFIKDEDKIKSFTTVIRAENHRMNEQIERVLEAAKADKQNLQLDHKDIDIHLMLIDLIEKTAMNFSDQKYNFERQFETEHSIVVGDKLHIRNMISNLLENACKYSPEGGKILVTTEIDNQQLVIRVSDQGIGISKDAQKKIFDKFYRVPTGDLHNTKGFGLGLHYAKTIAQLHGGDLTVESSVGNGSEFTIVIPSKSQR